MVSAICQRTIDLLQPSIAIESSPNTRCKTNSTSDQLRRRCAAVPAMSATNAGHPTRSRDDAGVPFGTRRTGLTGVVRSASSVVAVGAPSAQKSDNVTSV